MARLEPGVYSGRVGHKRFSPKQHSFSYGIFMPLIDLDNIEQVEKQCRWFGRQWYKPLRYKRSDYLGQGDLKADVLQQLRDLGAALEQSDEEYRVLALIQLRYFGHYFSPLNLYYVYRGDCCQAVLAEVSNTPWNERHYYYVPGLHLWQGDTYTHAKDFHVSPFNHCRQDYVWGLDYQAKRLAMSLTVLEQSDGQKTFSAGMKLEHHSFAEFARFALKPVFYLGLGGKMLLSIYWHALRLLIKGVPLYSHPSKASISNTNPVVSKVSAHEKN